MADVTKKVLEQGNGVYSPRTRSDVQAIIEVRIGSQNGDILVPRNVYNIVIEEADDEMWDRIDRCLVTMKVEEDSEFFQKESDHWYRIKLLGFKQCKEIWQMSVSEKIDYATHHKQKGNELFKQNKIKPAASRYSRALKYLISTPPTNTQNTNDCKQLKLQCLVNMSACYLKLQSYQNTVQTSLKALELDKNNSKALYRRGVAYLELNEVDKALADLTKARNLEPNSSSINDILITARQKKQSSDKPLQAAMKKMFL